MTTIDQALARVRELRKVNCSPLMCENCKQDDDTVWMAEDYRCRYCGKSGQSADRPYDIRPNLEPLLELLEALLRNTGVVGNWPEVEAALAAFVEGK